MHAEFSGHISSAAFGARRRFLDVGRTLIVPSLYVPLLLATPAFAVTYTDIGAGLTGVSQGSVAWGDYDSDGDLDILIAGNAGTTRISRIYRNDGTNFTNSGITIGGRSPVSAPWGDYDKDGDLDFLLVGKSSTIGAAQLFTNNGATFASSLFDFDLYPTDPAVAWTDYDNDGDLDFLFTALTDSLEPDVTARSGSFPVTTLYRNSGWGPWFDAGAGFVAVSNGSVAWGDYDKDGDPDLFLAGDTGTESVAKLYRNQGGIFTEVLAGTFPGLKSSAAAWGDYDADGDLDIVLAGETTFGPITRIYENVVAASFQEAASLEGISSGSLAWGDHDNDGDLDLLLAGASSGGGIARIYQNSGGVFMDFGAGLPAVSAAAAAWGDYDGDGDLDIVLIGDTGQGMIANVYRSDAAPANTPPQAPSGLSADANPIDVTLSWNPPSDAETPAAGLLYNVRLGTTPGGSELVSVMANVSTGFRRLPSLGNAQQATMLKLDAPGMRGTCYWSVQAIDATFTGSTFAPAGTFSMIGYGLVAAGLPNHHVGSLDWGDYDRDGDLDLLQSGSIAGGVYGSRVYRNNGGTFTDIAAGLMGLESSSADWGDYDNDGDLDIVLIGNVGHELSAFSRVYRNDGGTFTNIQAVLEPVWGGDVAWGDYDNDGDLDLVLTGRGVPPGPTAYHTRIYRNTGGVFTDVGAGLPGLRDTGVDWGDYDNDGELDLLLSGQTSTQSRISRVYRNDAGQFTDIGAGLIGLSASRADWGDYDSDGDLDLLLLGSNGTANVSVVYRNDAGSFTDIGAGLFGVANGTASWADYDNDGSLDILITGGATRVYRNKAGLFTDITSGMFPGLAAAWGDYDNDGDLDVVLQEAGRWSTDLYRRCHAQFSHLPLERCDRCRDTRTSAELQLARRDDTGRFPSHVGTGRSQYRTPACRDGGECPAEDVLDAEDSTHGLAILERTSDRWCLRRLTFRTGARSSGYGLRC
jgi:hypothetical protein